ncbi:membrane transporter protein, putative [Trypanosoma brucei gambiense DAL972]|uniref:Membrane transporter protein, putative n=1 Tax=Trypanosoma brucei gambiense (strain MHOM/CI/86/DAL972) TaxID=679716 RepID=C9ZQ36_TRYB9|nr:LOW QUALITY PROTEIN: membrane transporter protein, putative [Trypanosoma brucei gambiense DAL972]CBH11514.1 membrane transporter protein, putative [Trypanosoma brucei gambiense DAL972]|eukprot:XP_011773801.1 LOW QUALITY PROTEIN: membrane transporter protein, putative [Trypanosoma brucei gambiense DAL972]
MQTLSASFAAAAGVSHESLPRHVPTLTLLKRILVLTVKLSIAQVAQFSFGITLLTVVGKIGVGELGGASLANGLVNATVFAFGAGFSGALETKLSHTFSRNPKDKMYGVYTLRMLIMLLITFVLLSPAILFLDRVLVAMGQDPAVIDFTGEFCRLSIWGSFFAMLLELLRRYFACQHLSTSFSVSLVIGAVVYPFLLIGLVKVMGFSGVAVGWSLLMICTTTGLVLYVVVTKKYLATWGGIEDAIYRNWGPLLKLGLHQMAMMLSEWVALEINSICAGFGTKEELAAFGITYQMSGICWAITSGTFIAASVLVGGAIGEERPMFARRLAILCLGTSVAISLCNVAILLATRNLYPRIFTDDEKVVEIVDSLMNYVFVYHIFDVFQSCMMGVLRGCGMQKQGAIVIFFVYSVVGVPLGLLLFFFTGFGIQALWLGPLVGAAVVGFPTYLYMMMRYIKWDTLKPSVEVYDSDLEEESEESGVLEGVAKVNEPIGTEGDVITTLSSNAPTRVTTNSTEQEDVSRRHQ